MKKPSVFAAMPVTGAACSASHNPAVLLSAPILWAYMNGMAQTRAPVILDKDGGPKRIIGTSSYEVIHDGILHSIAVAYNFLYDDIQAHDEIDHVVIEQVIKRFADRIVAGGGRTGNGNMVVPLKDESL